jgi:hypothetical protein
MASGPVDMNALRPSGARLHRAVGPLGSRPPIEDSLPMRAEAEQLVETIKQSLGLLRRHL